MSSVPRQPQNQRLARIQNRLSASVNRGVPTLKDEELLAKA